MKLFLRIVGQVRLELASYTLVFCIRVFERSYQTTKTFFKLLTDNINYIFLPFKLFGNLQSFA